MKKRIVAILLSAAVIVGGCSSTPEQPAGDQNDEGAAETSAESSKENTSADNNADAADDAAKESTVNDASDEAYVVGTSFLGDSEEIYYDKNLVPSVESYKIADDFSNVYIPERFEYMFDDANESEYYHVSDFKNMLKKNNFAVYNGGVDEFYEVYEGNRYSCFPNFITVDSLLHTYHLYFEHLLENTEKEYLSGKLSALTDTMKIGAESAYEQLKGTDWEKAAFRNVVFFYTAELIQKDGKEDGLDNKEALDLAQNEYEKIMNAQDITECPITGGYEDYTQYKPRGYYTSTPEQEKYFRTMMWYGRIGFPLKSEDMVRSSVLMSASIEAEKAKWSNIYSVTSFFAGVSDDADFTLMEEIMEKAYGKFPTIEDIKSDAAAFQTVLDERKNIEAPQINSIPVEIGQEPVIPTFRFMGQRFTIDAAVFQRLMYKEVEENEKGEKRSLPDTLDIPAALGSERAYEILKEEGSTDYPNYDEQLAKVRDQYNNDNPALWNASLYSGWLGLLRPLLEEKKDGYPSYMQSDEWTKKNLETFAGSFAELKHDTILYAKQAYAAEMGDGWEDEPDDRGYVDPQPVVYSRFIFLSEKTKEGLEARGMLGSTDAENLDKLTEIGKTLLAISEKELTGKKLTDEDYEFIRCYGGYLEHFWFDVNADKIKDLSESRQAPCPVVADIATDPKGSVLEIGSGKASVMYVAFPLDGKIHIGSGSVYSFYQFTVPINERMTDEEFRERLDGGHMDENWNWVEAEPAPEMPQWTQSYRLN